MYWCNSKKHVAFEHNHVAQESRMGYILTSFDNHFLILVSNILLYIYKGFKIKEQYMREILYVMF